MLPIMEEFSKKELSNWKTSRNSFIRIRVLYANRIGRVT